LGILSIIDKLRCSPSSSEARNKTPAVTHGCRCPCQHRGEASSPRQQTVSLRPLSSLYGRRLAQARDLVLCLAPLARNLVLRLAPLALDLFLQRKYQTLDLLLRCAPPFFKLLLVRARPPRERLLQPRVEQSLARLHARPHLRDKLLLDLRHFNEQRS